MNKNKQIVKKEEKTDISKFVSNLVGEYRKKNMMVETGHIDCEFFDSGNYALNYILSGNFEAGMPENQVINVHGDSMTGKSLMIYNCIANFLKKYSDGVVILDDTEYSYVNYLGSTLQIDESRFIRISTSTVEEHSKVVFFGGTIKSIDELGDPVDIKIDEPLVPKLYKQGIKHILIAVDSIAAWSTEHEIDIKLEKPDMSKAKILRALLRTIMPEIKKYGLTYMISNHMIFNIGDMWGPKKIEGGGTSPAYWSAVRLCLSLAGKIKIGEKKEERIVGVVSRATTVKNRFAPPYRNCEIEIRNDSGMSRFSGLLKLLIDLGIVELKPGGWYTTYDGAIRFQSKDFESKWLEIKEKITPDRIKMRESAPTTVEELKED